MQVIIPNDLDHIYDLEAAILDEVEYVGYDENSRFALRLALDEALINAFKHGNGSDPQKKVFVSYEIKPDGVEVEIEDQGPGFEVNGLLDPRLDEALKRTSGRGIFLIRQFMSSLQFNSCGNVIRFTYERKPELGVNPHGLSFWRFEDADVLELDPVRTMRNPTIVLDSIIHLLESGSRRIIVDLKFLETTDSAVIGLLVAAHREAQQRNSTLILIRPRTTIQQTLRAARLDEILDVREDLPATLTPRTIQD